MIGDAITMLEFIWNKAKDLEVISALFAWDGTRLEGDKRIEVEVLPQSDNVWIYHIHGPDGYFFIRIPTDSGGVIESIEALEDVKTHKQFYDSSLFRYIRVPDGRIWGSPLPNVRVSFMAFGYKSGDLLKRFRPGSD